MTTQKLIFSLLFVGLIFNSYGQKKKKGKDNGITMEQTVEYLNDKLEGTCEIKVKKKRELFIDFFKNGEVYREDHVYIESLDTAGIGYSKEEQALIMRCGSGRGNEEDGRCVEREFVKSGSIKAMPRINFHLEADQATLLGIENAFLHMMKLVQIENYSSKVPFN